MHGRARSYAVQASIGDGEAGPHACYGTRADASPRRSYLSATANPGSGALREGDCDHDSDCQGNLRCFQRDGMNIPVPGCHQSAQAARYPDWDFCYDPSAVVDELWANTNPGSGALCEGDCDHDSDCQGNLRCFQTDHLDQHVPGCFTGNMLLMTHESIANGDWDYCYDPAHANLVEHNVRGVGGYGGTCHCPNGESYQVGDNNNGCGSLACINGMPGPCERQNQAARLGVRVTCAPAREEPYFWYQWEFRGHMAGFCNPTINDDWDYWSHDIPRPGALPPPPVDCPWYLAPRPNGAFMSVPWMPPLTNAHNCVVYLRDGGDGRDGGDFPDGTNLEDRAHNWILDEYEYVGDQNNFVLRRKQGHRRLDGNATIMNATAVAQAASLQQP